MEMRYRVIEDLDDPHWQEEFTRLPFTLYHDQPGWIAPLNLAPEEWFAARHPLLDFLEYKHFLVTAEGKTIGRATAFINPLLVTEDQPTGSIGFFECEEDFTAVSILVDKACNWLKKKGIITVWAPLNGAIYHYYRWMTGGFADTPFYKEPYNKPYYPLFFEKLGFTVLKRWYSDTFSTSGLNRILERYKPLYERCLEAGYRFRTVDVHNLDEDFSVICRILSEAYSSFKGFHPIPQDKLVKLFANLKQMLFPGFTFLTIDPEQKPCGFFIGIPEIRSGSEKEKQRQQLAAFATAGDRQQKVSRIIYLHMGLTQEVMNKNRGMGWALLYYSFNQSLQYDCLKINGMVSDNAPTKVLLKYSTGKPHQYALYEKKLT